MPGTKPRASAQSDSRLLCSGERQQSILLELCLVEDASKTCQRREGAEREMEGAWPWQEAV